MTPGEEETGFQIYLRQIAKFPLLTAEQEVELAGRIKLGDQQARADMVRANLKAGCENCPRLRQLWPSVA